MTLTKRCLESDRELLAKLRSDTPPKRTVSTITNQLKPRHSISVTKNTQISVFSILVRIFDTSYLSLLDISCSNYFAYLINLSNFVDSYTQKTFYLILSSSTFYKHKHPQMFHFKLLIKITYKKLTHLNHRIPPIILSS